MSRRRRPRLDSLELLLDTICNTFGGVLFIAILVVLLLQQTNSNPVPASTESQPVLALELQSIVNQIQANIDELSRLRQIRDAQEDLVRTFAPDEVRQLLLTRSQAASEQEKLQTEIDNLLFKSSEIASRVESLDAESRDIRTKLDKVREQIRIAKLELESDRQSRVKETRLPTVREAKFKTEIGLVLRYGRLYVWHKYGAGSRRLGLNTDDFVVVGEEHGGLVTRPNPSRGVPLDDSKSSAESVRKTLRQFDPETCSLGIIARPDSFGEFEFLRDRAIELGFDYRLMPADTDAPIVDRGGHGGTVQ